MSKKKTIRDVKFKNQNILVRTDYNVPLENGKVANDLRIRESLPTLQYLLDNGAKKVIIISHLGRPEGRRVPELSLKPVAEHLQKLLPKVKVNFVDDVSGPDVESVVRAMPAGSILLLENLRFWGGEERNSEEFIHEIVDSTHAKFYVQDGFAVTHRAHASTDAIARIIPGVAGLLVEKEISTLSSIMEKPQHPLVVLIGGAKVADKQPLIDNFIGIADHIAVGGKIAADGYKSEKSKIYVAEDFDTDASGAKLDIGPISTAKIAELIQEAKTVVWNGNLGKVEDPAYATSSTVIATLLGENPNIKSVICGGDTTSFVEYLQKSNSKLQYSLLSTGGGAALEFLSGAVLPGIDVLEEK